MKRLILGLLIASCIAASFIGPSASAQQQPTQEKGFQADKAYFAGELDAVNLFNGNLNLTVPLGYKYPVGGTLDYSFSLTYAGNNWDSYHRSQYTLIKENLPGLEDDEWEYQDQNWTEPFARSNAGLGWVLSFGRLFQARDQPELSHNQWEYAVGPWVYQSPDGGEHRLYGDLHTGANSTGGVRYTRDGTYIRYTTGQENAELVHILEFPDGTIRTFWSDGSIKRIQDRFQSRNEILFSRPIPSSEFVTRGIPAPDATPSGCTSSHAAIEITDNARRGVGAERKHYLYFSTRTLSATLPKLEPYTERACEVNLAGFGDGARAKYRFRYDNRVVSRQGLLFQTPPDPNYVGETVTVPLLTRIELPDGSAYEATYDIGLNDVGGIYSDSGSIPTRASFLGSGNPGGFSGHLAAFKLPTAGRYEWKYRSYWFPPAGYHPPIEHPEQKIYRSQSAGVETRTHFANTGPTETGKVWQYLSERIDEPSLANPAKASKTTLTAPDGSQSIHYFSACRGCGEEIEYMFGLPFSTRSDTDNPREGRYLSTRTFVNGHERTSYVEYESDGPQTTSLMEGADYDLNRRMKSRKTYFEDDTTSTEELSDFDGLGHHRTRTITAEASGTSSSRTTTTNYNPAHSPWWTPLSPTHPWVTETFDSIVTTEGTSTATTEYCFEKVLVNGVSVPANGFLLRKRTRRGPVPDVADDPTRDLLSVWGRDDGGNMTSEAHYGGDKLEYRLPSSFNTCSGTPGTPSLKLLHEYTVGVRSKTRPDGMGSNAFNMLDLTIDPSSGLPRTSRDTAGFATAFSYDPLGRISTIRPPESPWTQYVYSLNSTPPSVTANQWPAGASDVSGTELGKTHYYYDGLGRLIQESRRMPVGWSTTFTKYDEMNRREKVTSPAKTDLGDPLSFPESSAKTVWEYDTLGRVKKVTQPDSSTTNFAYSNAANEPSARLTRRTTNAFVATSDNPGAPGADRDVVTEEEVDGFGRLVRVTEDAAGAAIATYYQYDLADRLTRVDMGVQQRIFDYDRAGLLRSETHPESGTTIYEYDARGHVVKRTPALATAALTFDYDKAERLTKVWNGGNLLKESVFSTTADASLGKLAWAVRHNRHAKLPGQNVTVKETFTYGGPGGRISSKTTALSTGESFVDHYDYDSSGAIGTITYPAVSYPACPTCGSILTSPSRTVTTDRRFGRAVGVQGYTKAITANGVTSDGIQYGPNGLVLAIQHSSTDPTAAGPLYEQLSEDGMGRPTRIRLSGTCDGLSITSPAPWTESALPVSLSVTVTATGTPVLSWYERTATEDRLITGQTGTTLTVTPTSERKYYFARATVQGCSVDSGVAAVKDLSFCAAPPATITAPATVRGATTYSASVPATSGAVYSWEVVGASIVGSSTSATVQFTTTCASELTLKVSVTLAGCTAYNERKLDIAKPRATVTGSITIAAGQSATITAALEGVAPFTVTWSDGLVNTPSVTWVERTVSPTQTTTYSVSSVQDATGCTNTSNPTSATVTVSTESCDAPSTDMTVPTDVLASKLFDLALWHEPGQSYEWIVTNGSLYSILSNGRAMFRPGCEGEMTIIVNVTAACGAQSTRTMSIAIRKPRMDIDAANASYQYVQGGGAITLPYTTEAVMPLLTWSDGVQQRVTNGGTVRADSRELEPQFSTTYRVTSLVDHFGCSGDSFGQTVVTVCNRPDSTVLAPAAVTAKETRTASVPAIDGGTYTWAITGGTFVGSTTGPSVTFKSASCSGSVTLTATVTSTTCGNATSTSTKVIPVQAPAATVTGSVTIAQGSSASVDVSLTGIAPWTITWSDGVVQTAASSPHSRVVQPQGTTTYALASAVDASSCTASVVGSAVVTVLPPAPANVVARAISATQIQLSWTATGSVDQFKIYRNGIHIGQTTASSYLDSSVLANTAHIYHVVAVKAGTSSAPSTRDLATTVMLVDDPLVPGVHVIDADQILQLRTAVNAVRARANLANATFTDPTLVDAYPIPAHIHELRTALTEARALLGLSALAYQRPEVQAGDEVIAADVVEIRGGVQ